MNRLLRSATAFALVGALGLTAPGANQTTVAQAPQGVYVANGNDPFLWLEDVHGERAMAWVKNENAKTLAVLEHDPHYATLYAQALAIAQAKDRIAYPSTIGGMVYNFWQDQTHVHGIWRRTTPASYASASPKWTTVLDLDALSKTERKHWVWEGADCFEPTETRCMVSLSDGGEDAHTVREFDLTKKSFVKGGFDLPRGKQTTTWLDANTLLVAREWKPGELTASGYPYVVARLRRGQALSDAVEVYRGIKHDVSVNPYSLIASDGTRAIFVQRGIDFFNNATDILTPGGLRALAIPSKANPVALLDGRLLIKLDADWNVDGRRFPQGSLVSVLLSGALTHPSHLHPKLVYAPGSRESIESVTATKDRLLIEGYRNVRGFLLALAPAHIGWTTQRLPLPDDSSLDIVDTNLQNDDTFVDARGFLAPTSLYAVNALSGNVSRVKALPEQFNASNDVVEQHEAISKDGTSVPYFVVRPKHMRFDGTNPTVLYAYGGFQVSETPYYSGTLGKLWLERGGVFVLANIRGGGEFGPAWHEAGLKTHRQRVYDDFYAVGQDLIARKITTPRHLGIQGGSNGGLLMGVEFTQHPEMWNAVDIQVPLLDMLRFEKIEAGASWVGEYGSVTIPEQRAFLAKISPYNNLHPGTAYPQPLIWTTTKDDRVGPEHARKFAAMLAAMQVPYYFYEVTEGGHGSGANLAERAHTSALEWTYFTQKLMP